MQAIRDASTRLDCISDQGYDSKTGKISRPFGWWTPSYLYDYAAFLVLLFMLVKPLEFFDVHTLNVFDLADPGVQRPLYDDQLTVEEILAMCAIPSAFMYALFFFRRWDWLEDAHAVFCTLATGLMISNFAYFTLKEAVSRPRPDMVARCAPECLRDITWTCTTIENYSDPSLCSNATCCPVQCGFVDPRYLPGTVVDCPSTDVPLWQSCGSLWGRLVTVEQAECRGAPGNGVYNAYTIQQGFTSFPSGHVINISGVFMFNWLYLAGKLQVYGRNIQQRMLLPAFGFMSAFLFAVLYVVETRISNNKHRISDCIAGLLVGMIPMLFVYPIYFQSIFMGGEPLRRPKQTCWVILGHLCCRDRALQQPWPQEGWLPLPMFNDDPALKSAATNGGDAGAASGSAGDFVAKTSASLEDHTANSAEDDDDDATLDASLESPRTSGSSRGMGGGSKDYGTVNLQAVSQV